ncbi:rod shape-determining protein RodA [bacterium]|nr:MAG: rod shape-determining protein RodA [bacterium]
MIDRRLLTHFDWMLFCVTAALCVVGLAAVYSAIYVKSPAIYKKEIYWLLIGLSLMLTAVFINYSLLERFAYVIYGASILSLVAVFAIGRSASGAKRWISLGFFTIQPSEFAKLALIVVLARYFSARNMPERGMGLKDLAIPALFLLVPFLMIAKQPDLGTGIILCMIFGSMALIVKIRFRVIAGLVVAFAVAAPFAWKALKAYQKARLMSFLDPAMDIRGTGYHIMQSKIAIGSGGMFGKGFTKGTQGKLMFLPEHHTDFIFSAFAEEWGAIGSLVVISLFLGLVLGGLSASNTSKDRFGFLLSFGITAMIFWHVTINMGMVSGLLPVVGVPLPLISYGGSFLITTMIAVGLLINIRMRRFMF